MMARRPAAATCCCCEACAARCGALSRHLLPSHIGSAASRGRRASFRWPRACRAPRGAAGWGRRCGAPTCQTRAWRVISSQRGHGRRRRRVRSLVRQLLIRAEVLELLDCRHLSRQPVRDALRHRTQEASAVQREPRLRGQEAGGPQQQGGVCVQAASDGVGLHGERAEPREQDSVDVRRVA
eukprot:686156-Prymnesium_polylepis.1